MEVVAGAMILGSAEMYSPSLHTWIELGVWGMERNLVTLCWTSCKLMKLKHRTQQIPTSLP